MSSAKYMYHNDSVNVQMIPLLPPTYVLFVIQSIAHALDLS